MRKAQIERNTKETQIKASLEIFPEERVCEIDTGVGFLDHMLTLLSGHGNLGLCVKAHGDLEVDCHHTVEDIGIVLGKLLDDAAGDRKGIKRYGSATIPMDETLASVDLDFGGRPFIVFNADIPSEKINEYDTEVTEEFFRAVAFNCGMTLHINVHYGKNSHHIIEAIFKAFAHALEAALTTDPSIKGVLSTKGTF